LILAKCLGRVQAREKQRRNPLLLLVEGEFLVDVLNAFLFPMPLKIH
jgi:hypothetical protein